MQDEYRQICLVTGANRGIGLEIVRQRLAAGCKVIATCRHGKEEPLRALRSSHLKILPLEAGDSASINALAAAISGPIDVLINNAGQIGQENASTLVPALKWESFEQLFRVNSIAPLFITRALLPYLRQSAGAKVISISSGMGSMSYAKSDTTAYRASKAALNKIMQALATDLKPEGIPVAVVHPGWVRTDMGGPSADIDVATSAAGIIKVIEGLDLNETGQFFNYDGSKAKF